MTVLTQLEVLASSPAAWHLQVLRLDGSERRAEGRGQGERMLLLGDCLRYLGRVSRSHGDQPPPLRGCGRLRLGWRSPSDRRLRSCLTYFGGSAEPLTPGANGWESRRP
ncbi:hypothetical protein AAFF_G00230330 [Aldrovandia affinis]|uniref:Uncharacterized protein n=1 Tax=Aldrovandia affinis TaxID=143900 RepID=A0AAD7WUE5_9TELE|nr:hypothetical protein AAFF_G00230330 [Aldrovandia affinis]